jgi:hypothetical protein
MVESARPSRDDWLVFQKEKLVPLQFGEGECVSARIEKFDFEIFRRKHFDDRSDMTGQEPIRRFVHEERDYIEELDRVLSHDWFHST